MNGKKSAAKSGRKSSSKESRKSMVRPVLVLIVLILLAGGVAMFLVKHNDPERAGAASSPPAPVTGTGPVITTDGWTKGNGSAKTVLVEFGDFQCPSCAAARLKVDNVLQKFGNDIKVVFKEYPMQAIHRNAMLAAQAAEAAGRQMKFWEMHETLFSRQNEWTGVPDAMTFFLKYAAGLQLDVERFRRDMLDGEIRDKIFRDMLEGQVAQVRSVPSFYLNGKLIQGIKSDKEFEELIAQAIQTTQ